jgi:hypothetical protein
MPLLNGAFRRGCEELAQSLAARRTKPGAVEAHDFRGRGVGGVDAVGKAKKPRQEDLFRRGRSFGEPHHSKRIV